MHPPGARFGGRPVASVSASAARLARGGRIGSVSARIFASATTSAAWPDSSTRQTGRSRATPRMLPAITLSRPGPLARVSLCTRRRPWNAATGASCAVRARPKLLGTRPLRKNRRRSGGEPAKVAAGVQPAPAARQLAGTAARSSCASASPSRDSSASGVSCQVVWMATLRSVPALRTSTAGARSRRAASASAMAKVSVRLAGRDASARLTPGSARVGGLVSNAFRRTTPTGRSGGGSGPAVRLSAGSRPRRSQPGRARSPGW